MTTGLLVALLVDSTQLFQDSPSAEGHPTESKPGNDSISFQCLIDNNGRIALSEIKASQHFRTDSVANVLRITTIKYLNDGACVGIFQIFTEGSIESYIGYIPEFGEPFDEVEVRFTAYSYRHVLVSHKMDDGWFTRTFLRFSTVDKSNSSIIELNPDAVDRDFDSWLTETGFDALQIFDAKRTVPRSGMKLVDAFPHFP